jgi:hypothetical protein
MDNGSRGIISMMIGIILGLVIGTQCIVIDIKHLVQDRCVAPSAAREGSK